MVFSLRQLQEKCRQQRQPLFVAFVDLTKVFDIGKQRWLIQESDQDQISIQAPRYY